MHQLASDLSKNNLQIVISRGNYKKIPIWNIYNAPTSSNAVDGALSTLLSFVVTPNFLVEFSIYIIQVGFLQCPPNKILAPILSIGAKIVDLNLLFHDNPNVQSCQKYRSRILGRI